MAVLDDLFREQSQIEVRGRTLYIRAFSDVDMQARDDYALRETAKYRRKLADPNSDEYLTHLDWIDAADDDLLRAAILSFEESSFKRQAIAEITPRIIPIPDDADEQEKAETLSQREAELKATDEKRAVWVKQQTDAKRTELESKDSAELKTLAKRTVTNLQLWMQRIRLFDAYTLYAAVYADPQYKNKFVATPPDAFELPAEVRTAILEKYYGEMEKVTAMDLKYFLLTDGSPDTSNPSNG